jgi:hypothetical protein
MNSYLESTKSGYDLHQENEKLVARVAEREEQLRDMDREYLKLRAALIRIANGTDIDPVETAEKALKGKI